MKLDIEASWNKALEPYLQSQSFKELSDFVDQQYQKTTVYPDSKDIFNALNHTPLNTVKVVIIGQDPYHNPHQAHGLSFSVPEGITPPPSLKNIYREIQDDLEISKDMNHGDLTSWANQGVLLLNSVLTVEENKPGSHANQGWELFTNEIIRIINEYNEHCVFLLWGKYAQKKGSIIDTKKHLVLRSPHPSPLSFYRGFSGNRHFSQTNTYLQHHGMSPIQW
jgi:uracil-DNA glycosylase